MDNVITPKTSIKKQREIIAEAMKLTKLSKLVLPKKYEKKIIERCGTNVVADGIECPNCDCKETYKDGNEPNNTEKWFFVIRAFRVDNASECTNCGRWFELNL